MENLILLFIVISAIAYLFSCFLKPKLFFQIGLTTLFLGFSGNLYLIARHFIKTFTLPLTNTSETLTFLVTLIIAGYLVLEYKSRLPKIAGLMASLIALLGLYLAFYILRRSSMPLLPALQSRWLFFHVSSCIVSYGFFTIAFIVCLVYLFKKGAGRSMYLIMHRCVCSGFLFLTLGIILGSVWGKSAWGNWWNWDAKETWALITWLIYASYIHSCLWENRTTKKLAIISILGFFTCLFTYLGVNYLLKGLHSYG